MLKLFALNSVREIIEECGLIEMSQFEDAISNYENTKDLAQIENLFDFHYYNNSVKFSEELPKQGKLFKEFFLFEFDIYNLMLLLKKIHFELDKSLIEKYLIAQGKSLSQQSILSMLNAKDKSSFMRALNKTKYGNVLAVKEEEQSLLKYEILLQRFLLKKSVLLYHQHPLTVDLVLGYMFAKEIEVSNLRTIIKSKYLEFTEDYVKKLIVIK